METKIRRADQHLRALKQSFKRFRDRDPYTIGAEQDSTQLLPQPAILEVTFPMPSPLILPPRQRLIVRSFVVSITLSPKANLSPPILRWGTMIGDVVHNLASAMDNLVWELGQINPNPPPRPTGGQELRNWTHHWQTLAFPYCLAREDWSTTVDRCLYFVDPTLHTIFEEAQPFHAWEHQGLDPEHHPLWILHKLWISDKHRTVNLTTVGGDCTNITIRLPSLLPDVQELRTEPKSVWPLRELEGKTQVALIVVHLPKPVYLTSKLEVNVHGDFTLGVLFGQSAPGAEDNVFDVLGRARDHVVDIFNAFS